MASISKVLGFYLFFTDNFVSETEKKAICWLAFKSKSFDCSRIDLDSEEFWKQKKKLVQCLFSFIASILLFGLPCTLNETLVRSDMQKQNSVSVEFWGLGAVWVMGPLVLMQSRLTRNFKPAFIPPGWWGRRLLAMGSYQLERVSSENSCFMKMVKQKVGLFRNQKKKCTGSCHRVSISLLVQG